MARRGAAAAHRAARRPAPDRGNAPLRRGAVAAPATAAPATRSLRAGAGPSRKTLSPGRPGTGCRRSAGAARARRSRHEKPPARVHRRQGRGNGLRRRRVGRTVRAELLCQDLSERSDLRMTPQHRGRQRQAHFAHDSFVAQLEASQRIQPGLPKGRRGRQRGFRHSQHRGGMPAQRGLDQLAPHSRRRVLEACLRLVAARSRSGAVAHPARYEPPRARRPRTGDGLYARPASSGAAARLPQDGPHADGRAAGDAAQRTARARADSSRCGT